MMDKRTKKYIANISITIKEQNQYGDEIGEGYISYATEFTANNLSDLGAYLQKLEEISKS